MVSLFLTTQSWSEVINQPNENGITIFIIGILFILGTYHFLLYFQHKDRAYLYYSLYVFMIFIGLLNRPTHGFITSMVEPFKSILDHLSINFIISYNLVYLVFALVLLDIKKHLRMWYRFYYIAVSVIFLYAVLLEILFIITGNEQIVVKGHLPFTISIYLISLLLFVPLLKLKTPIKYYIIVGTTFLILTSLAVSIIKRIGLTPEEQEIRYSIFYIGLIIENIFFALALGHKQKQILVEKNKAKAILINQLKENEALKFKAQEQLKQDIEALSEQAKTDKLEKIKAKYDKELAEMKVSALRSQMNPHFIFNSLNSIKRYIIDNEKQNAVYYLNKFSKLIRKILSASMEKVITLADEIETVELYVNIENIRFNNDIEFELNIDESLNLETIKIPSLILQPFIENAIWHGLSSKKEDRKLTINVERETTKYVKIEIIDNGVGRERSNEIKQKKIHKRESVGLLITEERLKNFAQSLEYNYRLEFTDLVNKNKTPLGTKVLLKIPLK